MKRNVFLRAASFGVMMVLLLTLSLSGVANAATAAASKKLTVYAALNESDMMQIKEQFKLDTGIDIQYLIFSAGDAAAKVQSELKSPKADVMVGGSCEFYENLVKQNAFTSYKSPNAKGIDAQFNDPKGYWQGWYMGVLGIVYNTDRFEKELKPLGVKEPKTWDDLLDPRYKGLFITSNPSTAGGGYIFVADQLFRLGETKGWDYLNKLNANVHHYTKTAGEPISLVATGQFIVGMAWTHDIMKQAKAGYPIKVVVPENTAFEIGGSAIIKGAKNSANAKKFIDWLLTKEVQQMNTNMSNRYSVRKDITPPSGVVKLQDVKLVKYDRAKASAQKPDVVKKFLAMIGQ
jgi:iron(III) transport system substrate-binding protein